jgi:hypothetical protein
VADSIDSVIYAEAQRGLALQPVLLNELRSRTGILLAVTTASSSFLGALAIGRGGLHEWGVLALAAFAVAVGLCLGILWPSWEWKLFQSAELMLINYVERPRPDGEPWSVELMKRDLALHMHQDAIAAIDQMKRMQKLFAGAGISLAVTLVCWLIEYGT